ncbi:sigma factor [Paracoccus sp. NSM]|uniref:sigma factor n=1 Tax=Paracoccus sp. NSM TaxID=3457784 RepID=UPI0040350E1E
MICVLRHCPVPGRDARLVRPKAEARLERDRHWDDLLRRANQGDGAAFLRFLTEVTPALRALIRSRGHGLPPDQHEDVLQEVLLAIHLKRGTWDGASPVRPWLHAVARHKVVDAFRKRGRRLHLPIDDLQDMLEADPGPTPLAARDAERMLGMIDHRGAALVRAIRLEGKTPEEAAAGLGVTTGAARVALHRAMKRLVALAERMK